MLDYPGGKVRSTQILGQRGCFRDPDCVTRFLNRPLDCCALFSLTPRHSNLDSGFAHNCHSQSVQQLFEWLDWPILHQSSTNPPPIHSPPIQVVASRMGARPPLDTVEASEYRRSGRLPEGGQHKENSNSNSSKNQGGGESDYGGSDPYYRANGDYDDGSGGGPLRGNQPGAIGRQNLTLGLGLG